MADFLGAIAFLFSERLYAMHVVDFERSLKVFRAEQFLFDCQREFEAEQDQLTESLTPLRGRGRLIAANGSHGWHFELKRHTIIINPGVLARDGFRDRAVAVLYKRQLLELRRLLRARRWK